MRYGFSVVIVMIAGAAGVRADLFVTGAPTAFVRHIGPLGQDLGPFPPGSPFMSEEFNSATAGPDGKVYVLSNTLGIADIFRFDPVTGKAETVFTQDFQRPQLTIPFGIAFDATGALYVGGNRFVSSNLGQTGVFRLDPITRQLELFDPMPVANSIRDLAVGPDGALYVAVANVGVVRHVEGLLDRTVVPFGVSDVAVGPDGKLYVPGSGGTGVLRYDPATGAALGTFVAPGAGGLAEVSDLVFAPDGYLYLSSPSVGRIGRFEATTGAFAGTAASLAPQMVGDWNVAYVPEPCGVATWGVFVAAVVWRAARRCA
jgi:streptogramin lyase